MMKSSRFAPAAKAHAVAALREHRILLWIVALQVATSWWLCAAARRRLFAGLWDAYFVLVEAVVVFGLMALAVALTHRRRRGVPLIRSYCDAWAELRRSVVTPAWVASVALLLVAMPLSLAVFSSAKRTIPAVHPFAWDATIEHVGRAIHGGRHAWEWLQPIVGHPLITVALDEYYHLGWTLLIVGMLAVVILSPSSLLRRRYLTASVLLWFVVGTLAALVFSSAGPPYYDRVVRGPDPYAHLLSYLDTVTTASPLLSAGGRHVLWSVYRDGVDLFGTGISAMPSMHVATAALVACLGFAVRPSLGVAGIVAVVLTEVASVALGWHYALDRYVGAALAIGVWWVSGRLEASSLQIAIPSRPPRQLLASGEVRALSMCAHATARPEASRGARQRARRLTHATSIGGDQ